MYADYFGFSGLPFHSTAAPANIFASAPLLQAHDALRRGAEAGFGRMLVTGESGVGKTTLLRKLQASLEDDGFTVLRPDLHVMSVATMDGGCAPDGSDTVAAVELAAGSAPHTGAGLPTPSRDRIAVIVDDADLLQEADLRGLLTMFPAYHCNSTGNTLVLAGAPALADRLQAPARGGTDGGTDFSCRLGTMDAGDIDAYIQHKLDAVGAGGLRLFDSDAVQSVVRFSRGIPRRIDKICGMALLIACDTGQSTVGVELLAQAIEDLEGPAQDVSWLERRDALGYGAVDARERTGEAPAASSHRVVSALRRAVSATAAHAGRIAAQVRRVGTGRIAAQVRRMGAGRIAAQVRRMGAGRLRAQVRRMGAGRIGAQVHRVVEGAVRRTSVALRRGLLGRLGLGWALRDNAYLAPYPSEPYKERDFIFVKAGFIAVLSLPILLVVLAMLFVSRSGQPDEVQSARAPVESQASDKSEPARVASVASQASNKTEPARVAPVESQASNKTEPARVASVESRVSDKTEPARVAPQVVQDQLAALLKENRRLQAALARARETLDSSARVMVAQRRRIDDLHAQMIAVKTGMDEAGTRQAVAVASSPDLPPKRAGSPPVARRDGATIREGLPPGITGDQEQPAPGGLAASGKKMPAPRDTRATTYTVAAGDTLYAIARRFTVTVDELRRWNDLASVRLQVGQSIRVTPRSETSDAERATKLLSTIADASR